MTTSHVQIGDILHIQEKCLPPLLVDRYYPEGEFGEGGLPIYITRALMSLSDFTNEDREVGLPGCYLIRESEWVFQDKELEDEGDLVVTGDTVRLAVSDWEVFTTRVGVVGRVKDSVISGIDQKLTNLIDDGLRGLTKEDLLPRQHFSEAIRLALHSS